MSYPSDPGYQARDTSREAADAVAPKAPNLRQRVLDALVFIDRTSEELAEWLGVPYASVQPRTAELARMGKIEPNGERAFNASGKRAIRWRIKP